MMFVRIVHHWAKPGQTEAGRKFIDANGDKMKAEPGFKYRYRLEPPDGPEFMTTLTAWDSEESYQKYHSAQTPYSEVPTYPFARTESLEFIAQSSHGSAPM
jgi:heme-degrading monooxygenase HmoA